MLFSLTKELFSDGTVVDPTKGEDGGKAVMVEIGKIGLSRPTQFLTERRGTRFQGREHVFNAERFWPGSAQP